MKKTLTFLKALNTNNNRDWFNENKLLYEEARQEFIELADRLIAGVSKFDPEMEGVQGRDSIFRIYRDVRFSKDKSPYKTNFGASMSPGGRKSWIPGYYIHVEPGNIFLAGGKYRPEAKDLAAIRKAISERPKDYLKVINAKKFKEYFGEIDGDKLKTAPKGYPKDHPMIEHLRHKSFIAYHDKISQKQLLAKDFEKFAIGVYRAMKPLNDFLRSTEN